MVLVSLITISFAFNIIGAEPKVNMHVSADEFENLIGSGEYVLLDIRTVEEYFDFRLENAYQLDYYLSDFKDKLNSYDKTKKYLIYCRTSSRTSDAIKTMNELGFNHVVGLEGGIVDWINQGKSVVR